MSTKSAQSQKINPNQSVVTKRFGLFWLGGAKGIRTPDLLNAIQTRYQLRYNPVSIQLWSEPDFTTPSMNVIAARRGDLSAPMPFCTSVQSFASLAHPRYQLRYNPILIQLCSEADFTTPPMNAIAARRGDLSAPMPFCTSVQSFASLGTWFYNAPDECHCGASRGPLRTDAILHVRAKLRFARAPALPTAL